MILPPLALLLILHVTILQQSRADVGCDTLDGECVSSTPETIPVNTKTASCGIWFARSTIPNAGLGMYAGRDFHDGEEMMESGDVTIPIIDIATNQGTDWHFLWDSYTWERVVRGSFDEMNEVSVASPGFGSAANCFLDLYNVEEMSGFFSTAGLNRRDDPGSGAFSPHHNRKSKAREDIPAGRELFVSYGDDWFLERAETLGPIPVEGDLSDADDLLDKWNDLREDHQQANSSIFHDLWETFVWNSTYASVSRLLFALPKNWNETELAIEKGLFDFKKEQSTRSIEWLEENGICGDNMREGQSQIPQAGRGAFATRFLRKDSIIAPIPLLHIPDRKRLEMYKIDPEDGIVKDKSTVFGHQLLLNYCFGHRDSTLLLCPYGLFTSLINHSSNPNVKLRWSDPKRSVHNPDWLNQTVEELMNQMFAGLTMEVVALRDIEPGEEILVDYGKEWELAWERHVASWRPLEDSDSYISAWDLNADEESVLKTEFEQLTNPYPSNVHIRFDLSFRRSHAWIKHLDRDGSLRKFVMDADGTLAKCDILRVNRGGSGRVFYTTVFFDEDEEDESSKYKIVEDVPREAFKFVDNPHTADYLQPNVFRHDIRLSDDLFPSAWKNRVDPAFN